jgi:hypothetical protein
MASNGVAALHLAFEPAPESKDASVGKPDGGIEVALGAAVADAVITLYQAIIDQQQSGVLAATTKNAGASRIARIATLQLDHELGDDDFFRRAHEQGRCVLHRYLDADLFRQHGPGEVDMVLDAAIDSVFEIVTRVVKGERVFRAAWAN